ncbi:MAG: hypothetical protein ACJA13_000669 [Paraglaciecola sp.]|jgi:hypothetical protein
MKEKFAFKTQSGSYSIEVRGNIAICTFIGACCDILAKHYLKNLKLVTRDFNGQPWAYLGNAQLHQAATPQAEQFLEQAILSGLQNNCIADAYCLTSAVGIDQVDKIRQRLGVVSKMQDRLFADFDGAITQLTKELANATSQLNPLNPEHLTGSYY